MNAKLAIAIVVLFIFANPKCKTLGTGHYLSHRSANKIQDEQIAYNESELSYGFVAPFNNKRLCQE